MPTIEELESQNATLQRRLEEMELRAVQAEKALGKAQEGLERLTIEAAVAKFAPAAGAPPDPRIIDDLISRAVKSKEWKLDSAGQLMRVVKDEPQIDENGNYRTPLDWMRSIRPTAPHLFSNAQQQESVGGDGGARNPWTLDAWNMTEQGKIIRQHGIAAAEKMAAAVGSRLGDTRPPGWPPAR